MADLLETLAITKQSLNRVLKELIGTGFVVQAAGRADRRQRLLSPTEAGRRLADTLARLQSQRIRRALAAAGSPDAEEVLRETLLAMLDASQGARMRARLGRARLAE